MRWLVLFVVFIASNTWAASIQPSYKDVELKEFTSLSLDILPDGGTQLIFPFMLDNPELNPTLKIQLTNKAGFSVPTQDADLKAQVSGQNTITISGNATKNMDVYMGNLFISIGGYNLTIALQTTYEPAKHISNIVFKLDDAKREQLIEQAAERRNAQLEKQYKERIKKLDEKAIAQSLSHVAAVVLEDSSTTSFKEENNIQIDNKRVLVYIDKLISYGDKYQILLFDLENYSSADFDISTMTLSQVDDRNGDKPMVGHFKCGPKLKADDTDHCSFVTMDTTIKEAEKLKLDITTDRGIGVLVW